MLYRAIITLQHCYSRAARSTFKARSEQHPICPCKITTESKLQVRRIRRTINNALILQQILLTSNLEIYEERGGESVS